MAVDSHYQINCYQNMYSVLGMVKLIKTLQMIRRVPLGI